MNVQAELAALREMALRLAWDKVETFEEVLAVLELDFMVSLFLDCRSLGCCLRFRLRE